MKLKPKKKFPLEKTYQKFGSGPVILVGSSDGVKNNIMPIAWSSMLDFDPPVIGVCIGDQSHTFGTVRKTGQFTLNIPTVDLIKKVYACGQCSGKDVDKFAKFKFTAKPASEVHAPLIDECYFSVECIVVNEALVDRYNFFVAKVVAAWERSVKGLPKTLHHVTGKKFILGGKYITA